MKIWYNIMYYGILPGIIPENMVKPVIKPSPFSLQEWLSALVCPLAPAVQLWETR
jgi:hypothetical protein